MGQSFSQIEEERYEAEILELRAAIQQAIDFNQSPFILYKTFCITGSSSKIKSLQEEFEQKGYIVSFAGLPTTSKAKTRGDVDWKLEGAHQKTQILWKSKSVLPSYSEETK